jgi:carbon monoxide dehydrogenase subunit G
VNRFRARTRSEATLRSSQDKVWEVLTDPALLPELTPYLQSIDVDGDRWTWNLTHIPVMSATVAPTFTEVMTFDEPTRITFAHDPARPEERTGVEGEYRLRPETAPDGSMGTHVAIDLEIWCDLPLPRISRIAVETVMHGVVAAMGRRFAANMLRHLGE